MNLVGYIYILSEQINSTVKKMELASRIRNDRSKKLKKLPPKMYLKRCFDVILQNASS